MKKVFVLLFSALTAASALLLSSCSSDPLAQATQITLNGDTAVCEDTESVRIEEDGTIRITAAGAYALTGTLNDGQIYVDCVDSVPFRLFLNNASITNPDGACIFIKKAADATITLVDGTVNTLVDGESYTFPKPEDDEPDAVLFSKEDLTMDGTGTLVVDGNYGGGIYSKDGLFLNGGTYQIDAVGHGIKGKDFLVINDGNYTVRAIGDGIKSTNYDSELVGYIEINGGTLDISSEDEGIQAVSGVKFNGGTVKVVSTNNGLKCAAGDLDFRGGSVTVDAEGNVVDAMGIQKDAACTVLFNGEEYSK